MEFPVPPNFSQYKNLNSMPPNKIDKDIGCWIVDFLVRRPMCYKTAKKLTSDLQLDTDDPVLQRRMLLGSLVSEIWDANVHENFLDKLEEIQMIDKKTGIRIPDSMKSAYCAVAVQCTMKLLAARDNRLAVNKYFEAVERIWRGRISNLEANKSDLVTDDLLQWRDNIECAVWNDDMADKLLKINTRNEALQALTTYLNESYASLGSTLLDSAIRVREENESESRENNVTVLSEDKNPTTDLQLESEENNVVVLSEDKNPETDLQPESRENNVTVLSEDKNPATDLQLESQENNVVVLSEDKNPETDLQPVAQENNVRVWSKRKSVPLHRRHGRLKISTDYKEEESQSSDGDKVSKITKLSSAEVSKVKQALKTSVADLAAMVQDPLPEALLVAQVVLSEVQQKNANMKDSSLSGNPTVSNDIQEDDNLATRLRNEKILHHDGTNSDLNDETTARVCNETMPVQEDDNLATRSRKETIHVQKTHKDEPKPSLMKRNHTARTLEWEEGSRDKTRSREEISGKAHFPIPKREVVTPTSKYNPENAGARREKRRWSLEEEETLRKGVNKFGKGSWTLILNAYADTFEGRTAIDLKDKWRNMIRMGSHKI